MLCRLDIRDFVLVDRLALEFEKGFTVLSGETGAGKSIMIDALAMVLGERADASLVRQGCDKSEISAEFDLPDADAARQFLDEHELAEDSQCLLRRVIDSSGARAPGLTAGRSPSSNCEPWAIISSTFTDSMNTSPCRGRSPSAVCSMPTQA